MDLNRIKELAGIEVLSEAQLDQSKTNELVKAFVDAGGGSKRVEPILSKEEADKRIESLEAVAKKMGAQIKSFQNSSDYFNHVEAGRITRMLQDLQYSLKNLRAGVNVKE